MSVAKTYVLLDHTKPSANVSIQINQHQRMPIGARRFDRPALQIGFTDKQGQSKILRFKLSSSKIFQDEQIKDGILANDKFTQREYDALVFRHGILVTKNETVQKFLDAHPQNEEFWNKKDEDDARYCAEILQPLFKEYNKSVEIKASAIETKLRVKAASHILSLDIDEANGLLTRLQGSFVARRTDIDELHLELIDWADQTNMEGIEALLKTDLSADEQAKLTVAKAIEAKLISFDAVPGQVVKVKGDNKVKLKEVPEDFTSHEQQVYFADFLLTDAGKQIYQDLKSDLEKIKKPKEEKKETEKVK